MTSLAKMTMKITCRGPLWEQFIRALKSNDPAVITFWESK